MNGGLKLAAKPTYPLLGNIVAPYDSRLISTVAAIAANDVRGHRVVIPYDGVLHGLSVYVGGASGNIDLGILDTTATTRNKLYSSGSIVCAGANAYQSVDPNLAVKRGDHLDFVVACDNAVATFGRYAPVGGGVMAFPTGFLPSPLGGVNKVSWLKTTSFPIPSTVAESAFTLTAAAPWVGAYLTPNPS